MFFFCFPDARLNLSDEDNVVALVLTECSARSYAELIKSNIPSSSSLMSARSSASRPPPPSALGVSSFGPTAATPTRGEILIHMGATTRKPRSVKRKNPSSSGKDRPVPAKVQKLGRLLLLLSESRSGCRRPWPRFRVRGHLLLLPPKSLSGHRHPWPRLRIRGRLLLLLSESRRGRRHPWF